MGANERALCGEDAAAVKSVREREWFGGVHDGPKVDAGRKRLQRGTTERRHVLDRRARRDRHGGGRVNGGGHDCHADDDVFTGTGGEEGAAVRRLGAVRLDAIRSGWKVRERDRVRHARGSDPALRGWIDACQRDDDRREARRATGEPDADDRGVGLRAGGGGADQQKGSGGDHARRQRALQRRS